MSEESKALEDIILYLNANEPKGLYCSNIKIIKTALKNYELEHALRIRLENINYELVREKEKNQKRLKAFEIVVRKKVNMQLLIESIDLDFYNSHWFMRLCQEEYDIVKEALK